MIQDPGGLLARMPELEPLCQDPAIRRAVEKGEPFALYRALWWARLTRRLEAHRAALSLLLRSRRAFARPLKGKLWLGTFNGFGATLMGSGEAEPDGSRIAVHWIVALFAVPIFPLGAYVVSGGERSGLSTSWNVYARVPLGLATWAWSRGVALAIALAVAWAGVGAVWASRHHELAVVNGLKAPLTVRVGDVTARVPALQHVRVTLPVGRLAARAALEGGAEVDALDLDVRSGNDRLVWNVAGAAPVYVETVLYEKAVGKDSKPPEPVIHCGDRQVTASGVDDFLSPPPRQVSMSSSQKVVIRRHLDVAHDDRVEAALFCASSLADSGRLGDAVRVAEARAAAGGWEEEVAGLATGLGFLAGPAEHERVARAYRAARPGAVAAEREYQTVMEAGHRAELLAEYAKRAAAAPADPKAQYLHLRLLEGPDARAGVEAALARFPKDPDLLRLAVAVRAEARDFAEVVRGYRELEAVAPAETGRVLWEAAGALIALGRGEEARATAAAAAKVLSGHAKVEAATVHVLAAARLSGGLDEALLATWEKSLGGPQPHLRARVGAPAGAGLDGADAVHAALWREPARALELAAALPPYQVAQLEEEAWSLAYYEAVRSGAPAAGPLRAHHYAGLRPRPEVLAYVRGEPVGLPPGLTLQVRAAAQLVRSRVPGLGEAERRTLLAEARADDRLDGLVTRASTAWPPATR